MYERTRLTIFYWKLLDFNGKKFNKLRQTSVNSVLSGLCTHNDRYALHALKICMHFMEENFTYPTLIYSDRSSQTGMKRKGNSGWQILRISFEELCIMHEGSRVRSRARQIQKPRDLHIVSFY